MLLARNSGDAVNLAGNLVKLVFECVSMHVAATGVGRYVGKNVEASTRKVTTEITKKWRVESGNKPFTFHRVCGSVLKLMMIASTKYRLSSPLGSGNLSIFVETGKNCISFRYRELS